MNILLLSMPDSFEHMPPHGMRIPTAALTSLAGNIDTHHNVSVADMILAQGRVRAIVERLVRRLEPDLVGLSVMTFQRRTALKIVDLLRALRRNVRIVAGGYDPSLAPEAYACAVDFVVRGEGEITFRELVRAVEQGSGYGHIRGLSYRIDGGLVHNAPRTSSHLDGNEIRLPNRAARVLDGYTLMGRRIDVIETSRGCTFDCGFCSIVAMRGRNFHTYALDRVLEDIRDAQERGARAIFLVDDNITLDVPRFEALCRALVETGLNRSEYIVQAMTSAIANHGETLAPLMRRAGFRYVFLGIENVLEPDLAFLHARSKNQGRMHGDKIGNTALLAIEHLHRNGLYVVGGLIVGNPGDTRASIEANLEFARRYVDWPYIQHPTPYPGTPMSEEFRARNLVVSDKWEEYDGTTAVARSEHLQAREIEFLRWRAERWMKVRHVPAAFFHSPLYVTRIAHKMFAHTFRGSSLKSMLGLEDEHKVFERYRALRQAERDYL